jgi:hypothetical protein
MIGAVRSRIAIGLGLGALCLAVAAAALALGPSGRVGPYPSLGGCPVFPKPPGSLPRRAASVPTLAAWNQDISHAPVARNSRSVIAYINSHGGDHLHPDFGSPRSYGFPYSVVGRGQPRLPIHYTAYGSESDRGPFPVPRKAPVEGGQRSDGDRHVLVVDRSSCRLYELGRAFFRSRGRDHWDADAGATWSLRSARRRTDGFTSADAAGLPIFPGLVRFDEARRGQISHAFRITFDSTRDAWVHPASHCAGDTSSAAAPAMGTRLRLKAGYSLRGFSGGALAIARALKQYGVITADNGSNWFISGASDRRWDDQNLDQLKRIPGSAFEVVRSAARPHLC